jgi:pimeloyl-ACP methyl ester carboxylesterase
MNDKIKKKPAKKKRAKSSRKAVSAAGSTAGVTASAQSLVSANPSAPFEMQPEEVESALVTGQHADLLKRYFGDRQYAELVSLARDASARSIRGGHRVLIVPGIMGSTLGSERAFFLDDVIWVDPGDIAAGHLISLALFPGPSRHKALGVILFVYLRMKLELKLAGYDADFHPFDWRQSIDGLGQELAKRISNEPATELSLVAHSMGGLVSRAAMKSAGKKVKRLIMMGTPNYGSFVPIQALRGIYPIIRKIALLDVTHSPEELTQLVFNTFTGLYQMLPAAEKFSGFDVFDLQSWPKTGPIPRKQLLDSARKAQGFLAAPDARFILIAGIDQDTATDVQLEGSEFKFSISKDGDGTVPLAFAQLPNVPTYFVEESHGSLPNNSRVIAAVKDLLALGQTTALPQQRSVQRAAPRIVDEETVRNAVPDAAIAAQGRAVSDKAVRELLEEVAAPASKEEELPAITSVVTSVNGIVVGRRRQRRLDLRLAHGSITEANSRAYVLGIFRDVTPTGAAQAIDRRMNGAIAEFNQRRMFGGDVGEVFVIPTGRHALIPDHVLLAGMGTFDQFTQDVLELVSENVIRTLVRSGVDDFATVLMGGSSGKEVGGSLQRMLSGFVRGLLDADQGRNFRRVTLCEMDTERFNEIREHLYRLASTNLFDEIEVSFEEEELPAPPGLTPQSRGLVSTAEAPAYLLVRQEASVGGSPEFQASVLTSGSKAAIVTGRKIVARAAIDAMLAQIGGPPFDRSVAKFGATLSELVLHPDVLKVLPTVGDQHLVVVHDVEASRIPWETLCVENWVPALAGGLSRRYSVENLSVAKLLEQRKRNPVLKILLVVDPTSNLAGAVKEGERITELFSAKPGFELVKRFQNQATKPALLKDFSSGEFDVLHYAGHAFFDVEKPSRSGIICAGNQVLTGPDLVSVAKLPNLVFFNACESARTRKAPPDKTPQERTDDNRGLAEAYLRGGVANYMGTYWPVGDEAAMLFADEFYTSVINGTRLGEALFRGRKKVEASKSVDWADYVFYGSPDFVLKQK